VLNKLLFLFPVLVCSEGEVLNKLLFLFPVLVCSEGGEVLNKLLFLFPVLVCSEGGEVLNKFLFLFPVLVCSEGEVLKGSRASLNSSMKLDSDSEASLNEYGDIDAGKFTEDGSFIGDYGNNGVDHRRRGRDSNV